MAIEQMSAVVCRAYGGPEALAMAEVAAPTPRAREVRIKVHATTVTAACGVMRRGARLTARLVLGLRRPRTRHRVMGTEVAGEIDRVGAGVTRFRVGDRVFGFTGFRAGAYAQFCCLPEHASLALIPTGLSYEEAASLVDGPTTALYFLRDRAHLERSDRVLILGASGSIGTAAVQIARHFGAEVTGVCSGANRELVTSLGASRVIDYTKDDFTEGAHTYDIVFDTRGTSSFGRSKRVLADRGRYLVTSGGLVHLYLRDAWSRFFGTKTLVFGMSVEKGESLRIVRELVESGVLRPVVDRHYALSEIVAAHRYVDTGRKRGNVVIQVTHA
jgi:NADPH:quinone reductase-like Zn-dependent oxidoreductase